MTPNTSSVMKKTKDGAKAFRKENGAKVSRIKTIGVIGKYDIVRHATDTYEGDDTQPAAWFDMGDISFLPATWWGGVREENSLSGSEDARPDYPESADTDAEARNEKPDCHIETLNRHLTVEVL